MEKNNHAYYLDCMNEHACKTINKGLQLELFDTSFNNQENDFYTNKYIKFNL